MNSKATKPSDRELVLTCVIDAPRERLFRAWTTQLPHGWGPHGMTTPVCEMDLRPGGIFRTVLRAPDGTEYPTQDIFLEVVASERIVFTDKFGPGWQPSPDLFFTAITPFEALPGGRTKYTARALLDCHPLRKARENWILPGMGRKLGSPRRTRNQILKKKS